MDYGHSIEQLKQALQTHRHALEQLESALVEFEESISAEATRRPQVEEPAQQHGGRLLSIAQVCQNIGMGKSWVYRRLRSGEIPSVKLGRTIKVRHDDLEGYLERHRYPARQEAGREE